ncbi:MAG: pyruvate dehydrogenase complex dihydrolipoamide acetyltransferase [Bryobacteraceae bacterium]
MDVLMPQLGETVAEGKIKVWFKSLGDTVAAGDNLFEIETDKVSMEVPAITGGVLSEIRAQEGDVVPVGGVVAVIGDSASAALAAGAKAAPAKAAVPAPVTAAAPAAKAPEAPKPPAAPAPAPKRSTVAMDPMREVRTPERNFGPVRLPNGVTVTPLARRLAFEAGVNLAQVKGSGPHGRIIAGDVQAAMASGSGRAAVSSGPTLAQVKALYKHVPYEEVTLDGMRKVIAKRLVEASQTVPHFYLSMDVNIDRVMALREELNASAPKNAAGAPSFKLSLNDLIVKAFALALTQIPAANAVWAEDRILRFQQADIGVAVAIEGGLLTPVVRNADTKSVFTISTEMRDFATRARDRKLKPDEYQGGAAAISNLGMYGIREFSAIINPPHATILAIGAGERRPVENGQGGVSFATKMTVTLSCDHRVVDGALGAQLLGAFKSVMEAPATMLI